MNEADFWDLTPRGFFLKYKGWQKQEEELQRCEWERARFVAVMAGNAGMYKKALKESQFRFPWEKQELRAGWSNKEDLKRFREECEKLHGKNF